MQATSVVVRGVGRLEGQRLALKGRDGDGQVVGEQAAPPEDVQQRGQEEREDCGGGDEREGDCERPQYPGGRDVTVVEGGDGGGCHGKRICPPCD